MLVKACFIAFILWAVAATSLFPLFFHIEESDKIAYLAFTAKEAPLPKAQNHYRDGVTKDLFLYKEGERKHVQIKSATSHLAYSPKEQALIEDLFQIQCLIEEGEKRIQKLESERGVYSYKDLSFNADEVEITLFNAKEDPFESPSTPTTTFLNGTAQKLSLSMKEGFSLRTKKFKAHINNQSP
jgi:hypothetical protein